MSHIIKYVYWKYIWNVYCQVDLIVRKHIDTDNFLEIVSSSEYLLILIISRESNFSPQHMLLKFLIVYDA